MSEKVTYFYADNPDTESETLYLIEDPEKLAKWLSMINSDMLNEIEVTFYSELDKDNLGEIAEQALEDYIGDPGECQDDQGDYFCFAIFDSDKRFLGFGKALFEYTVDYTGKEMYKHQAVQK